MLVVENEIGPTIVPLQAIWFVILFICTLGFTVIVKEVAVPGQKVLLTLFTGVTVIVLVIGLVDVLLAVKFKSPVPVSARPIAVLELVQVNKFAFAPEKIIEEITVPSHTNRSVIGFTVGVGSIVIITFSATALQGPLGSFVVNVSVTSPIKLFGGLYVLFKSVGSEKVPPEVVLQTAEDAAPPTFPFNVKVPFSHKGS
jgi:hypothetical protein